MTGIYPEAYWYNRTTAGIIRLVHKPRFGVATLMIALAAGAGAQAGRDQRPPVASVTTLGIDYACARFQLRARGNVRASALNRWEVGTGVKLRY